MRLLLGGLLLSYLASTAAPVLAADDFKLEPGFTLLFNGKDLTGWKEKSGGAVLDGKTEAYKGRFTVKDGVLVIDPKVKGDVRVMTTREFTGDMHLKFEYKPGEACNNDLFLRGTKFDIIPGNKENKNVKKGEWTEFEIIIAGDKIEFKNAGEVQPRPRPRTTAPLLRYERNSERSSSGTSVSWVGRNKKCRQPVVHCRLVNLFSELLHLIWWEERPASPNLLAAVAAESLHDGELQIALAWSF